jgi:acyl transferase domain-containing protein/acyl carrier protein
MNGTQHIAVVGMAGRFPGADSVDRYWANLRDGVECVEFPTDEELLTFGVPRALLDDPSYVKARATAPFIQDFDASLFGYTAREADNTDPQIRMFLECAHASLEHAGYDPYEPDVTISVYGSAGTNRYIDLHLDNAGDASATSSFSLASLNYTDHVASTTAYRLNLRGAAITVSTACSSSLVAVHLASQALRNGECDLAVAGGSEIEMPFGHGYLWSEGGPFARDGHVRPFDAKADGTMFSSGVGTVVLRRLADAIADGDTIHAVLRGSALNNDGASKAGFTAPSVSGQAAMLAEAFAMADVTASDLSFVECHATGTPVGDPIEVAALQRALGSLGGESLDRPILLGSVKSAIGHLGHAAGVASLIKAILALKHGQLPKTVNFSEPNPKLDLDRTPLVVADRLVELPGGDAPRIGGVSSFGVGGTNAHVVVQEPPARPATPVPARPRIVVWSARSEQANRQYRDELRQFFAEQPDAFAAAAHTLRRGRRAYAWRSAVISADAAEATAALTDRVVAGSGARREVVFAFPGQGSQQVGMAAKLYRTDSDFAATVDEVLDRFAEHGVNVRQAWLSGDAAQLAETVAAQALLFTVEYALAHTLMRYGVRPAALIGHSVGELSAAAVAGVFSLPDGVALVAARARAMAQAPAGAMLAVALPADDLVAQLPAGLTIAAVNGPRQCVLSGGRDDIERANADLRARGVEGTVLNTAGAFHSPLMLPAARLFAEAFDQVALGEPQIPIYSAAAGGLAGTDQLTDAGFWADQVAGPVRFDRAMAGLLADGNRLVLEVGPNRVITSLGRQSDVGGGSAFLPVLPEPDSDVRSLLSAVASVWTEGHEVAWPAEEDLGPVRRVPTPGYPYQRRRHWVEPVAARIGGAPMPQATQPPAQPALVEEESLLVEEESLLSVATWTEAAPVEPSALDGHCLVLVPEGDAGLPLVLALQQAGATPVLARPGQHYASTGGEFRVRPTERADLERALADLAARGTPAALAVHALTLADPGPLSADTLDDALERGFGSLLALAQATDGKTGLLVVSRGAVDVTGAEPVDPTAAMVVGFARSLALEAPQLGCRVVDVAEVGEADLAREVARWQEADVVALRGSRRWTAGTAPFAVGQSGAPIRRRGVYLVTGGTGGLGIAVARGLAGTGQQPRIVLLSRTGLDDDAADERAQRLRAQIAELTGLGAVVRVIACDVADRRALRRALDLAYAQFGAVSGVFHLAGVPGDGLVRSRDPERAGKVLAPKVRGTVLLAEALRDRPPLDFFVCFSSLAAHEGLIGSADYAAANGFQDAFTTVLRRSGVPALSVNWPSWAQVGMAAEYGVRTWSVEIGPENTPIMDEHRLRGGASVPGTGQVDLMMRGYLALTGRTLPIRLSDVVYHEVLISEHVRQLIVRLHPDGTVESWSRPLGEPTAQATRHASARIAPVGQPGPAVDLDALSRAMSIPLAVDHNGGSQVFVFGPRWDNILRTWTTPGGGTGELLQRLRLPDQFVDDLARHAVHPALLDSALDVFHTAAEGFHLPFCCESIEFFESLPVEFYVHQRRQPAGGGVIRADLDFIGLDGHLIGRARGFTMRKVEPDRVGSSHDVPAGDEGIEPATGVRLTLSLLGAPHPGQVLVRPATRAWSAEPAAPRRTGVTAAGRATTPSSPAAVPPSPVPATPTADALLEQVKAVWVDAIGDPNLSADSDFFDVGGNSLTAVALIGSVRERFGVDISVGAIFDYPTVGELTSLLRELGAR